LRPAILPPYKDCVYKIWLDSLEAAVIFLHFGAKMYFNPGDWGKLRACPKKKTQESRVTPNFDKPRIFNAHGIISFVFMDKQRTFLRSLFWPLTPLIGF
jgi:hypothetical protein